MSRSLVLTVLLALVGMLRLSGAQSIADAPPRIDFEPWKVVSRDDSTTESLATFPSAYVTNYPENNQVELRIIAPNLGDEPMPVVLLLHYWGARDLKVERSLAAELCKKKIAAAIITLPYHLSRTPPGYKSGELAVQPDPRALIANSIQSVWDVRRALDCLQSDGRFNRYAIAGTSLGAIVAELSYAVEPRFRDAAFILGGADLAHLIWNSSRIVRERDGLRRKGYTEERLRDELKTIEPSTFLKQRGQAKALVISARYDTVIPAACTAALQEALPEAKHLTVDTGHYGGLFVQRRILREVANYFSSEFANTPYTPPSRIYAPTLRIGATATSGLGFNLAAGIDLLKFEASGQTFSSLLITTRGPQLFLGRKIDSRISFGVIGSRTRVGVGFFWSTVL